jgi:ADP-ribose pyrophosphatase YjhB (NUDIX family)
VSVHPARVHFRHCPRCGAALGPEPSIVRCATCGFIYYLNPTVAVAAIVEDGEGRIVAIERAKEPAKGMLALPGGFVDVGERAEDALRRELVEELGLEVGELAYVGTWPNRYTYKGVTYPVVDVYYSAHADRPVFLPDASEVTGVRLVARGEIDPETLAFASMRAALRTYLAR